MSRSDTSTRFDGWIVVGAVFFLVLASSGLGFYGLAVYLDAIIDEQGFSNSSVSFATSLFFLVSAIVGRAIANPVERGQTRGIVVTGGVLAGGSLAVLGQVEQVWQLYAVYTVFAAGFAMAGLIPCTTLVTRWFHVRRSVALALASSGLSVGGLTLTQLASWLIRERGLADAAPVLGLLFFAMAAAAAVFMWPSPESRGQLPDGRRPEQTDSAAAPAAPAGVDYGTATRTRFFWTTTFGFVCAMSAQVGSIAHLANLGTQRFEEATGAQALLALAVASAGFRLHGGSLAPRVPMMSLTAGCAVLQGISQALLAESGSATMLIVAAFIMGATIGNLLMLQPLLMAETFGVAAYPRIFSLNQLIVTVGIATGPFVLGALEDGFGYRASYWVAACLSVLGATIFLSGGSVERTRRALGLDLVEPAPARDE